jgi:Zn-dependent protease with chaperone function/tellurite resistance protein
MDFFESQERAKRNTSRLVAMFVVALLATMASVHVLITVLFAKGNFADVRMLGISLGSVLVVVVIGMAVKFAQMSHGGRAVAEAMGGVQVDPGSADPAERRILNVVEEMAIASGVRVPPVFLIDEPSINAFAAGNGEQDAVIGVTRGCIEQLSRDELQGVMAHEFSHIFHRDTRLNMQLVAWLGGIFAISLVGRIIMRSALSSGSSRGKNDGKMVAIALGAAVFLIGIVGYFFGRIIQSAVSRQREYLADASAVQYTRNPDGIAGALEKIAHGAGSRISAPAAAEFSHFFFANGIASLFSTHPPLEDRIARIRGARMVAAGVGAGGAAAARVARSAVAGAAAVGVPPVVAPAIVPAAALRAARAGMGSVDASTLRLAGELLVDAPAAVLDAARNPFSARAVVCLMLLSDVPSERSRQLRTIAANDPKLAEATSSLAASASIAPRERMPVLEVCAASLTMLSPAQYAQFRTTLAQLIAADGQVDRVEWTVRVILRHAVEGRASAPVGAGKATMVDLALVVSVLAWSGASDEAAVHRAWRAARAAEPALPESPDPAQRCTLDALDGSLRAFAGATPGFKRRLVDACVACAAADGQTTVEEAELLRAVCASIGAPMPPVRQVA